MKRLKRLAAVLFIAGMALTAGVPAYQSAHAHESPTQCSTSLSIDMVGTPNPAHLNDTISFKATFSNQAAGSCDISGLEVAITTPDGVPHPKGTVDIAHGGTAEFTQDYKVSPAQVKSNKVTATVTGHGLAHDATGGQIDVQFTTSVDVPPKINVLSVCTVGATLTNPLVKVKGTTQDAPEGSSVSISASTDPATLGDATTLANGTWEQTLDWLETTPDTYQIGASVSYGDNNRGDAVPYDFAFKQIIIDGGDSASTHERKPVISGITDADPGSTVVVTVDDASEMTLVEADLSWSLTWPYELSFAPHDVTAELTQDSGSCASDTQSLTVFNTAPVAMNDEYTGFEDTLLTVPAPGVLANDTDPELDPLTAILVADPMKGTLGLNPDGSFSYMPNANENSTDSFTYKANDGTDDSNVATVVITITPVNDPPVAVDDSYTTDENALLTIALPGVLGNDTDIDGDPLTAILGTPPTKGMLTLNGDGSFTYMPNPDVNGSDSFTYKANDGTADSNEATVAITINPVNDPPVAKDDAYTTLEDTPLTIDAAGVLANDTDVDGDPLTAIKVTDPAKGTLTFHPDGSFTYTPNADENGMDGFTYKANDGTADSNVATVVITITPVNDPPVALNDAYFTNENTPVTIAAPGLLSNDTDKEGDSLTAVKASDPAMGSVTLNANGSFTYTPNPGAVGTDSFTYRANDHAADSNLATVNITIYPVNDPPVAASDTYSTAANTTLSVGPTGVLANDTDPDGDTLIAFKVTDPLHGVVTLLSNGSFTYTPNSGFSGTDTFSYQANDGAVNSNVATVAIYVTPPPIPPNHAPVAANDAYTTDRDQALTIAFPGVLGNDSDSDGDALTALSLSAPTHGTLTLNSTGSFTYTPNPGFVGSDSFTYRASDGSLSSNTATVLITVVAPPDPPTVEGTIIDAATGQPVVGAAVKVRADFDGNGTTDFSWSGVTGADGKYRLQVERRDWTYTAEITAQIMGATGPVTVTTTHQTDVRPWHSGLFLAERKIAGQIQMMAAPGTEPKLPAQVLPAGSRIAGTLWSAGGSALSNPVAVLPSGLFEATNLLDGDYRTVLQVIAPDGTKLNGSFMRAKVRGPGELVIGTNLIDPGGQVIDAVSLKPVYGAKVTLYWADTQLNRDKGRVPNTPVTPPALPGFDPGLNAMPQVTTVQGIYSWLVYPEGDYYIRAESYRYLPYDSRDEGRTVAALAGQENYVQDGVIHVGNSPLKYDFIMEPIHRRFIVGYPDGTFKPDRMITRAEVAAILARNTEPAAVTLPLPPFKDVPAGHWAATYIELVRQKGFMFADPDGNFRPDQPITRAELASAVARFRGLAPSDKTAFPDIRGHWAEKEINAAYEAGLIQGYPDGTFRPEASTRRDEAATMINRVLGRGPLSGRLQATWPDVPLTNWASGQVEEASSSHSAVRDDVNGGERWTGDTGETTW